MRARLHAGAFAPACATLLVLAGALAACSHDLDALRSGAAGAGGRSGSGGASGTSGAGSGGTGGAGSGGIDAPDVSACAPCEVSDEAAALGFVACCRGLRDRECGLQLGEGGLCLPRDVPGTSDASCPGVTAVSEQAFAGCCRPDARCGIDLGALGLGCLPREELPTPVGSDLTRIACGIECAEDGECAALPTATAICVPHREDRTSRFCAAQCARDRDCPSGQVCGLGNDVDLDRLVSYCQPPIGDVAPEGACASADDCEQGVCIRLADQDGGVCSRLCESAADCAGTLDRCVASNIARPVSREPQRFSVCSN